MLYDAGIFVGGLVLISLASLVLSTSLERIGVRFGFPQALLGIVTALGADSPEIASAITALHRGNAVLGVGVVFGSNLFNLASLLGLSAVTAGFVRIAPQAVIFNGTVSLCLTYRRCAHRPVNRARLDRRRSTGLRFCAVRRSVRARIGPAQIPFAATANSSVFARCALGATRR